MCEDNYSNAHGFPWTYKTLKIGKLIGAPVPGTMTAVWWETQIDPSIVFGIPQVGMQDMQGRYLDYKKGFDIVVLDVGSQSMFADYLIIAAGGSERSFMSSRNHSSALTVS